MGADATYAMIKKRKMQMRMSLWTMSCILLIHVSAGQPARDMALMGWPEGLNEEGGVLPAIIGFIDLANKKATLIPTPDLSTMLMFGVNEWKETSAEIAKDKNEIEKVKGEMIHHHMPTKNPKSR